MITNLKEAKLKAKIGRRRLFCKCQDKLNPKLNDKCHKKSGQKIGSYHIISYKRIPKKQDTRQCMALSPIE